MARLNYLELPVCDLAAGKAFYEQAFDWTLTDFGPSYAATTTSDTDLGLQADAAEATAALLPVIAVDALEDTLARVVAAGGRSRDRCSPFRAGSGSISVIRPGTNWPS